MTHILLVEDDPAIAMSLKVTCKREGWQITWLDNASSVLPFLIVSRRRRYRLLF